MNNIKILYEKDNYIKIIEYIDNNETIRVLSTSDGIYSASSINNANSMVFPYFYLYDLPVQLIDAKSILMLGAGAFTYPKYVIHKHKDVIVDAIEIDKTIIDLAYKFFFLDTVDKNRINIFNCDAIEYIKNCNQKYDYIFLDIFNKNEPNNHIRNKTFNVNIKNYLNSKGIFAINYIINKNKELEFINFLNMLEKSYNNITILTIDDKNVFDDIYGNIYIMCYDIDLNINIKPPYKLIDISKLKKQLNN